MAVLFSTIPNRCFSWPFRCDPLPFRFPAVQGYSVPYPRTPVLCCSISTHICAFPLRVGAFPWAAIPVHCNTFPSHSMAYQCNSGSEQFTSFPSRCFSQLIRCDSPPTIASAYLFAAFPALSKSGLCKSHAELIWAIPRLSCASFRFASANQNDAVPFPSGALLCLCVTDHAIPKRFNAILAMPMLGQAKQIWLCNSISSLSLRFRSISPLFKSFAAYTIP